MARKKRVLFICTGNSARSQMAEGWVRRVAGDRVEVVSAGTEPASEVHPLAVRAMKERGIDISAQRPKDAARFAGQTFDVIITTCDHAREHCPFFPGGALRDHWSIDDPAAAAGTEEERLEAFRRAADEIRSRVQELLERLSEGNHGATEHTE